VKKYLVFIRRSDPQSQPASWEFATPEEVAKFLVNEDPHRVSIFIQVEGLDFTKGSARLAGQLFGVALETDLNP